MRYLKSITLALVLSIGILAGIGYFLLKEEYKVEKTILIEQPKEKIYPYLSDLNYWKVWSPWNHKKDPTITYKLSGGDASDASKMQWNGEYTEAGIVQIKKKESLKSIGFQYISNSEFVNEGLLVLEPQGKNTKVIWRMQGNVGSNIPQRYFLFFMEKFIQTDMEEGLYELKKISERE